MVSSSEQQICQQYCPSFVHVKMQAVVELGLLCMLFVSGFRLFIDFPF